jgi:hypothetical protein
MLLLPLASVYRNMLTSFPLEEYLFNEPHSQSVFERRKEEEQRR